VRLTVGPASGATKQLAALRLTDRAGFTPRLKLAGSMLRSDQFRWANEGSDLIVHLLMPVDSDVELSIETTQQPR
jgi:hypothetical protein